MYIATIGGFFGLGFGTALGVKGLIVPVLAIAGSLAAKRATAVTAGVAVRGNGRRRRVARYPTMRKAFVAFALAPPAMARAVIVSR